MATPRADYEVTRDEMIMGFLTFFAAKLDELTALLNGEQEAANKAHKVCGQISDEIKGMTAELNRARTRYYNDAPQKGGEV